MLFDTILRHYNGYFSEAIFEKIRDDLCSECGINVFGPHVPISQDVIKNELLAREEKLMANGRKVFLLFSASTIPINNKSFPRGVWVGETKFPLISEKFRNASVALLPAQKLRYPRYRHLALPKGFSRVEVKSKLEEVVSRVNELNLEFFYQQISLLSFFLWRGRLPLVQIPIELIMRDIDRQSVKLSNLRFWEPDKGFRLKRSNGLNNASAWPSFDSSLVILKSLEAIL